MFARAVYLGCYPLGGNLEINGIRVMQTEWKQLCKPIVLSIGKRREGVNPIFCEAFVAGVGGKRAFFLAHENGIGKYHIFRFSDKATEKLYSHKNIKTKS